MDKKAKKRQKGSVFQESELQGGANYATKQEHVSGKKGCATNREVILYNYRKMIND